MAGRHEHQEVEAITNLHIPPSTVQSTLKLKKETHKPADQPSSPRFRLGSFLADGHLKIPNRQFVQMQISSLGALTMMVSHPPLFSSSSPSLPRAKSFAHLAPFQTSHLAILTESQSPRLSQPVGPAYFIYHGPIVRGRTIGRARPFPLSTQILTSFPSFQVQTHHARTKLTVVRVADGRCILPSCDVRIDFQKRSSLALQPTVAHCNGANAVSASC